MTLVFCRLLSYFFLGHFNEVYSGSCPKDFPFKKEIFKYFQVKRKLTCFAYFDVQCSLDATSP